MLRLPKIDEEISPLKIQYKEAVLSKVNSTKNKQKQKFSKYDWITCQINFIQHIQNQAILKELIKFQLECKDKQVQTFYSYFFFKSLFLNKYNSSVSQNIFKQQGQRQSMTNQVKKTGSAEIQTFIMQNIKSELKRISTQSSIFHKIQNYIFLRQDLLRQMQQNSKNQTHNLIHQNANNIRFLNFQIVQLIKTWKRQLYQLQTKTFSNQNVHIDSLQLVQPMYVYQDQNYLNKMIYDNSNAINILNSKKQINLVSPPNPFFLSVDGNKQYMSQKQKDNIDEAMEFFAKQKALELKLLIDSPQYISKGKINHQRIKSANKKNEKSLTKRQESNKKVNGSLTQYGLNQRKNSLLKQTKQTKLQDRYNLIPEKKDKSSLQRDKILSAYQIKTAQLKQQIQKTSQSRQKFQNLIKKSQLQLIKDLRKKKSPPKQNFPKVKYELKTNQQKLAQSPYKQKISALRRQIQKNVAASKITPQQQIIKIQKVQRIQQASVPIMNKSQLSFKSPLNDVRTPKPKIKLITQRQVNVDKIVNPILELFAKKSGPQKQEQKQKSKQKPQLRRSFSTFYKPSEQQVKKVSKISQSRKLTGSKQMIKERKNSASKVRLAPVTIQSSKELKKVPDMKASTSINFLYAPKKMSSGLQAYLKPKRKSHQQSMSKQKMRQQEVDSKIIDSQLKQPKERVRDMQIMKIYGRKKSSQSKRSLSQSNVIKLREQSMNESKLSNSPYKKQNKALKNHSGMMKKQALQLQQKIERLLKRQQKNRSQSKQYNRGQNQSIKQQDQTILNQYKTLKQGYVQSVINDNLTQNQSIIDQKLKNLQKKKQLIQQSNQIKQKQIQTNKKTKQKISTQLEQRKQRLKLMEEKIKQIKNKRKNKINNDEDKLKQSILAQKKSQIISQQGESIHNIKLHQSQIRKKNIQLQKKMKQEQQRFIKLKEQQFKMRQEMNKKKYLQSLQQMKSRYLQKQQQYQQKILEQQKERKQNQIKLMKQKRQTQQLQLKLQQQQMKQMLLKEILNKQQQRWNQYQKQADVYQQEIRKKIQLQIRQKQDQQMRMNQLYESENNKLLIFMKQLQERNKKLQEANRKKQQQLQQAIKQKQQQIKKLQELQKQVNFMQQSRIKNKEQKQIQNVLIKTKFNQQKLLNNNQSNNDQEKTQKISLLDQKQQEDIQELKLRVKQQILKQMISRRKRQEQEQKKFQQQRQKRLRQLQDQIKQYLRKQDQMNRQISQGKFQSAQAKLSQLMGNNKTNTQNNADHINHNNQQHKEHKQIQLKQQQKAQQFNKQLKELQQNMPKISIQNLTVSVQKGQQKQQIQLRQDHMSIKNSQRNNKQQSSNLNKSQQKIHHQIHSQNNQKNQTKTQKNRQLQPFSIKIQNQNTIIPTKDINQHNNQSDKLLTHSHNNQKPEEQQMSFNQSPLKQNSQIQSQYQSVLNKSQKSIQKIQHSKTQLNIQQQSKTQQPSRIQQSKIQQSKIQQQKSQSQTKSQKVTIKQSNDQVINKYQNLKQHFNLKTKFLLIQQSQIESFVNKFYSNFSPQVKQMIPYNKQYVQTIMKSHQSVDKKIDIFDCNTIGWFDRENNKYILIGPIQCVHLIAKKYGQIQIQIVYIFNRANIHQKQYLAKQIKLFEKTGYVYQKKLKQDNEYSIKFIIKIPRQVIPKGLQTPKQLLEINQMIILYKSSLVVPNKQIINQQKNKNIFWNILFNSLLRQYTKQQIEQYCRSHVNQSIDLNLFIQSLIKYQSQQNRLSQFIKHQQDNVFQISLSFKLSYLQLGSQIFYSLTTKQYQLNNSQKIYLSDSFSLNQAQQTKEWKFLILQTQKSVIANNFVQTFLSNKINQINYQQPQRQLNLLIPPFKITSNFSLKDNQQLKQNFTLRSNIKSDLIPSSISSSNSHAGQERKVIRLSKNYPQHGFIFCACYCPQGKIDKIVAGSWIGYQDLIK